MIRTMEELLTSARTQACRSMVVAAAQDADVLAAVYEAAGLGLIRPLLVGDRTAILEIAREKGLPVAEEDIVDESDKVQACMRAAALVRDGAASLLMKGMVDTAYIMKAVLSRENHLRRSGQISHVLLLEVPGFDRLFYVSDSAMVIAPTLEQKADILRNAVEVAHALGNQEPKAAALCAVEKVNPKMPCTLDAEALARMNREGIITGCVVDGPLALDNAVSLEAARHKGIDSPVAGAADILLVPDIEAGNLLIKSMEHFAHAKKAGVIVGAKVPVVLTSRATAARSKLYSIALGVLTASSLEDSSYG